MHFKGANTHTHTETLSRSLRLVHWRHESFHCQPSVCCWVFYDVYVVKSFNFLGVPLTPQHGRLSDILCTLLECVFERYWQLRRLEGNFLCLDMQWPAPDINQWTVWEKIDAVPPVFFGSSLSDFALVIIIDNRTVLQQSKKRGEMCVESFLEGDGVTPCSISFGGALSMIDGTWRNFNSRKRSQSNAGHPPHPVFSGSTFLCVSSFQSCHSSRHTFKQIYYCMRDGCHTALTCQ